MNQRVLRVLEYHKIVEKAVQQASTYMGKERTAQLQPLATVDEVRKALAATEEGRLVFRLKGLIPLGGIRDIRQPVKRSAVGGTLNSQELLDVADTIMASRRLRKFLLDIADEHPIPTLRELAEELFELRPLEEEIRSAIDSNAEIVDHASPDLKNIRQEMRQTQARIKDKLDSLLRNSGMQKMMQEAIVTIRNDRYCIPIKAEYKGSFNGIVHDQSSSGATLFIEPAAVVQLNNFLRELEVREQREVDKILARLSVLVGNESEQLQAGLSALAEIDFIFAKAHLAHEMKASNPKVNDEGRIYLKKAVHPLLDRNVAVPVDIRLGDEYSLLVITGPNTGGKTVTLKTVGLFALMAMSGLHVPAEDGSEVSTFDEVFADIGDEQSIEQSLSTFSSHMTNIVQILERADVRSLVLLDELGAGTDPAEGAALAQAILDFLRKRGAKTVATTHYSELKAYAFSQKEAINASVEFDVDSLRPTYRLLIGVPGRSNAFAISERLGLRREIIEDAKSRMNTEDIQVDELIRRLETNQLQAERERREAEALRKEMEALRLEFEKEREQFLMGLDRLVERAEEEAREIVKKAEREAQEIIQELRKIRQQEQGTFKEHQLIELRKQLENAAPTRRERRVQRKAAAAKEILPGDTVQVLTLNQKGTVLEVGKGEAFVQIGSMKMKIKLADLEKVEVKKNLQDTRGLVKRQSEGPTRLELDLRGFTIEEAAYEIDRYLDNAIMAGLAQVSIIHGKGTGALRAGVHEFLRNHPQVRSFRIGEHGEGHTGVTIVSLK
ncbi:endonuclease MutS2 [Effusibacillus lacus]|uniref:Endonuclease MutS2 n=1 Tax=Effusibacillus lacus TaxID=1348429 RepID=A0A292YQI0_9BACL|nr:endonuclease MutS2 [Effusibacillus lacus]TCS70666.1 DNA mismatch repair protein MutS2 [Effusibacillus lacus]GAX90664.1 endonuclease MutS2 [Effusibacillus lacus]